MIVLGVQGRTRVAKKEYYLRKKSGQLVCVAACASGSPDVGQFVTEDRLRPLAGKKLDRQVIRIPVRLTHNLVVDDPFVTGVVADDQHPMIRLYTLKKYVALDAIGRPTREHIWRSVQTKTSLR